jgi:hypothetical protein
MDDLFAISQQAKDVVVVFIRDGGLHLHLHFSLGGVMHKA